MTTDDTRRSDGQGRHRLISLPVDDLLMALNYEGADVEQQDTAPAWKAARDRVLTAIYEPDAYTCPTACVEQNHPGREHDLAARGGNTDNGLRAAQAQALRDAADDVPMFEFMLVMDEAAEVAPSQIGGWLRARATALDAAPAPANRERETVIDPPVPPWCIVHERYNCASAHDITVVLAALRAADVRYHALVSTSYLPAWPEVFDAVRRLDAAAAASAPTDNPSTRDRMAWLPSMTEDERATLTRQDALAPTDRED